MLTLRYLSSPQLCVEGSLAKSHKTLEPLVRVGTTSKGGGMSKMKTIIIIIIIIIVIIILIIIQ